MARREVEKGGGVRGAEHPGVMECGQLWGVRHLGVGGVTYREYAAMYLLSPTGFSYVKK